MIHYARIISCYTADTSGVCSALYELGGMVVVHDASGCNSTYATHDEPRWYDMDSMIYVSALTEIDAVMGNDERFINDVCRSAEKLGPKFIAICGSPMPAMTGTDFDALASVIQSRCGIPTHPMHTNGMKSYVSGASEAFEMLARCYCGSTGNVKNAVNILGATPLDLSRQEIVDSIWAWLKKCGFEKGCCMAMGSSLDDYKTAGDARCNLVVSSSGLRAAKVLQERFGTPYVVGLPLGEEFAVALGEDIHRAVEGKTEIVSCALRGEICADCKTVVVGESVYAGSLARGIMMHTGKPVRVIHTLDAGGELIAGGDRKITDEDKLEEEFAKCSCVIADPLFKPIAPANAKFVPIPHEAFSGRCFRKNIPDLVDKKLGLEL